MAMECWRRIEGVRWLGIVKEEVHDIPISKWEQSERDRVGRLRYEGSKRRSSANGVYMRKHHLLPPACRQRGAYMGWSAKHHLKAEDAPCSTRLSVILG
jgi:hypothetical protein